MTLVIIAGAVTAYSFGYTIGRLSDARERKSVRECLAEELDNGSRLVAAMRNVLDDEKFYAVRREFSKLTREAIARKAR